MEDNHIPKQEQGAQNNTVELVDLPNVELAKERFKIAGTRLLDISNWSSYAKGPSSEFKLTDRLGNEIRRAAQLGDHIKIDLPGPGSWLGSGDDWVRIEEVITDSNAELDEEQLVITVRPCPNPLTTDTGIAHFFDPKATNTFVVMRRQSALLAGVYGRNELPNSDGGFWDNLRNKLVALSDMAGSSHPQWKMLVKGLLEIDK